MIERVAVRAAASRVLVSAGTNVRKLTGLRPEVSIRRNLTETVSCLRLQPYVSALCREGHDFQVGRRSTGMRFAEATDRSHFPERDLN